MRTKTITTLIATAFLFCSCGGGGNRQATAANNETNETTVVETVEIVPTDPVIIDIVGNLENKREFRLSDFGSSVQYIRLQLPEEMNFGNVRNVLSNDDFIFFNTIQGLYVFSAAGEFINTLADSGIEEMEGGGFRLASNSVVNNGDLTNGRLLFRTLEEGGTGSLLNILDLDNLSENSTIIFDVEARSANLTTQPTFQRTLPRITGMPFDTRLFLIDEYSFFVTPSLTAVSIQTGDTLFMVHNYHQPTITGSVAANVTSTFYRIGEKIMMQLAHNDTVFALIPPNRLEPAFIMNWGEFKPDMNRLANGGTEEGKFVLQRWVETQQHIFIEYTEGRAFPIRWAEGNVRHHWAIFDKESQTLTHHYSPRGLPMRNATMVLHGIETPYQIPVLMFENDIDPVGMPFFPQGINHRGEMYMVFSKAQVQQQIATGKFNNSRLQALYNRMPDGSFYLMIVK